MQSKASSFQKMLLCGRFSQDTFSGKSALTKHNLALAYNAGDMIIHGTANDSKVDYFVHWLICLFHTCDDYTHCDGRSDTNCVEISSYEQSCDLHIIINTQTGSAETFTASIGCDYTSWSSLSSVTRDSKNLSLIEPTTAASILPQVHNQIRLKSTFLLSLSRSPPLQLEATCTVNLISYHL